jgi:hypothetical protein
MAIQITGAEDLAAIAAAGPLHGRGRMTSHKRAAETKRHKITCSPGREGAECRRAGVVHWTMLTECRPQQRRTKEGRESKAKTGAI